MGSAHFYNSYIYDAFSCCIRSETCCFSMRKNVDTCYFSVSINITVTFGHGVVDVANNVQNVITTAVENMTGVKVTEVNVNVCGIVR